MANRGDRITVPAASTPPSTLRKTSAELRATTSVNGTMTESLTGLSATTA